MGGRYRKSGKAKIWHPTSKSKPSGIENFSLRISVTEMMEKNKGAEAAYQLFVNNKWLILVAFTLLWITKITIVSMGDPVAMVTLASNTSSITNAGLAMLVSGAGTLAPILFMAGWSRFSRSDDRDIEDKNRHAIFLYVLGILSVFVAPLFTVIISVVVVTVISIIERFSNPRPSDKRYFTATYTMYYCVLQALIFLVLGGIWLPSENISTKTEQFKGYLIKAEDQYSTFLVDRTRGIRIYPNEEIVSRSLCIERQRLDWSSSPLVYSFGTHEMYPKCAK